MSTFLESIQTAPTENHLRHLIRVGNNELTGQRKSGKTRRGWLRAATQRRKELQVPVVTRALRRLMKTYDGIWVRKTPRKSSSPN